MNTQITLRNADVQIVDADQLRFQVAERLNVARYLVLQSMDFERNEQSAIDLVIDGTYEAYQIYRVEVKDNVVTFVYLHRSEGERRRAMKHFFVLLFIDPDGSPHVMPQCVYEAIGSLTKVEPKSYKDFLPQA